MWYSATTDIADVMVGKWIWKFRVCAKLSVHLGNHCLCLCISAVCFDKLVKGRDLSLAISIHCSAGVLGCGKEKGD